MENLSRFLPKAAIFALFALIGLPGCDALSSEPEEEETSENASIEGLWQLEDEEGILYVHITGDTITIYESGDSGECFSIETIDILSRDGNDFTISTGDPESEGTEEITIILKDDGNSIEVTRMEDGELITESFEFSTAEISELSTECTITINGTWQLEGTPEEEPVVVHIEDNFITHYDYVADGTEQRSGCYIIDVYEITEVNGNEYTLENENDPEDILTITIELSDDGQSITVTSPGDHGEEEVEVYFSQEVDLEALVPECKEEQPNPDVPQAIAGTWQQEGTPEGEPAYVHIEENLITRYAYEADENNPDPACYRIERYEITEVNGNEYMLQNVTDPEDIFSITIEISEDGDSITVTLPGDNGEEEVEVYFSQEVDLGTLAPECEEEQI